MHLKLLLKRGALLAAANWPVVLIQFAAQTTFQVLLAVPIVGAAVLVAAADACSASRPGARRETLDRYIKRMQELESIATGFQGVEQAFAIQAGREVRVIASTKFTTDESAAKICREIAMAFEQQLTYPGEIRVTMIRESRFTETAK